MVNIWNDKISFPLFIIRGDLWRCFGIKLHYNHCKGRISGATKLKIGILALGMTKLIPPPLLVNKAKGLREEAKISQGGWKSLSLHIQYKIQTKSQYLFSGPQLQKCLTQQQSNSNKDNFISKYAPESFLAGKYWAQISSFKWP